MKRRRVKITGVGPVTPAGVGKEAFWRGILEPVSYVRGYDKLGAEDGPLAAAYLDNFEVGDYFDQRLLSKGTARHAQFAAVGGILALRDAGIDPRDLYDETTAVVVGSSLLDFGGIGDAIHSVSKKGSRGAHPRVVYTSSGTSTLTAVALALQKYPRTMSTQNSCCSGLDAVGYAAGLVASGEVDIAICGGTEAPLHRFPLLELRAAGLTPTTVDMISKLARPFDLWRTTGVISEGAGMMVIESEESPRPAYAYISGYAFANDINDDLCGGMTIAGQSAIASAGIRPSEIDSISAWGPGHKLIDRAETVALNKLFGENLANIPVVSIKGAIGNPLGAAPAIQVIAAALGLKNARLPPTVNWEYPDPACMLNLSAKSRSLAHSTALINSHGVGAVNSCVVLKRE